MYKGRKLVSQSRADAGFPQGMVNLVAFYVEGRGGLTKDYARAVDLCRKATEADNPNGMALLATTRTERAFSRISLRQATCIKSPPTSATFTRGSR